MLKMAVVLPILRFCISLLFLILITAKCSANDILGCGGFVKSHVSLDFSKIEIGLYTKAGSLKEKTECAPTNGYYFLPLYEKGEYILKVHPPAGWSFEPSEVELLVDGKSDQCSTSQDINFSFNGFGITGRVVTAGQKQGPSGISVELVDDKGNVRSTVTAAGGDFHFTPVIPGKYTLKASHPRWKLEPSQAIVQVKEGNTALPVGVLAVKGYEVKGSITSFGSTISGLYVLLYSKEENPKFRVEGCNTALLQGVPDAPICHAVTDAAGEFHFGLVPAGDYKLLVLGTPPGQISVTYNVKPDKVAFSVLHDSLYIKNAFEVTGFTVVGTTLNAVGGKGMKGVRVLLDGRAVATTDGAGKFTLSNLQPGTYTLSYQHEQCEFEESQVVVTAAGPVSAAAASAARWRVCGAVAPPHARPVVLAAGSAHTVATPGDDGEWCTYLPPGVYTAKVDVSEQEQRDGLQFYPLTQKVSVGNAAVSGIVFSQLKGRVTGNIICKVAADCASLVVTLRPLSVDGGYVGQPLTTVAKDGAYEFKEVLPGSVELSLGGARLCWRDARLNVALARELLRAPPFRHAGYVLRLHLSHDAEVEYKSAQSQGVLAVPRGASSACVPEPGAVLLRPRGCRRYQPHELTVHAGAEIPETAVFVAVSHEAGIRIVAPVSARDVRVHVSRGGRVDVLGPVPPHALPGGGYAYDHTLYLADGEECSVWATSESLVVERGAGRVVGRGECEPRALTLRAARARTLAGRLEPRVAGVTLTLTAEDLKLVHTTTDDGTYKFGPLDASKQYTITAEKESYVFSGPDDAGVITAHKLAEITVELVDEEDNTPLVGGLVSVSGGSYRRAAAGGPGRLRFAGLQAAQYYVKPHMKEYRFQPAHRVLDLAAGRTHHLTLKARRVAWSCRGALHSLGGAGWAGAALAAAPRPPPRAPPAPPAAPAAHCVTEEATTEPDGTFRIRGLLPDCVYTIELKESTNPELAGLKLAKPAPIIEIKDKKDIENVRLIAIQPQQLTDASVVVRAAADHYRTVRLSLSADADALSPVYTTRLDAPPAPRAPLAPRAPALLVALPRLPADNRTYVLQLDSTLSKATHVYEEVVHYFVSDGRFKSFEIDFFPKVKTSEQELRQSSVLALPLALALCAAWWRREALGGRARRAAAALSAGLAARARPAPRRDPPAPARVDHVVSSGNAPGKRVAKRRFV